MCTPLAVAGLVATAAGTGASIAGQRSAEKAQGRAIDLQTAQQEKFNREKQQAAAQTARDVGYEATTGNLAKAQQQRISDFLQAQNAAPSLELPAGEAAPKVIQTETKRATDTGRGYATRVGTAESRLGALNDLSTINNILLSRGATGIGTIANQQAGSAALLPLQLAAAREKGGNLRTIGDILTALGGVSTGAAAIGAGPSWGSLFGKGVTGVKGGVDVAPGLMSKVGSIV